RFEIEGALDEQFQKTIEEAIVDRLQIAQAVVKDFQRLKACLREIGRSYKRFSTSPRREPIDAVAEARLLIEWLLEDNFVFMGICRYAEGDLSPPAVEESTRIGFTRSSEEEHATCAEMIERMGHRELPIDRWLVAYKSQEEALIHRAGKIDHFLFRALDSQGAACGTYHLKGLFTFKAIQTPGGQIPLVRRKLKDLLARSGHPEGSLAGKSYANAFNCIPVEFLFGAPEPQIAATVDTILYVEKAKELRSHLVVDKENRKGLYFLVLPRQGYSEELRARIEGILFEALGATYSDSRVHLGKFDAVLLSFFFTAVMRFRSFSREELDERVRAVAGTWEERLQRRLAREAGKSRGSALLDRYSRAFSEEYKLVHPPSEAVIDVTHLERIRAAAGPPIAFEILCSDRDRRKHMARLRVYQRRNIFLSTILPVLDNFGLQVVDQSAFQARLGTGGDLFIDTFRVAGIDSERHPLLARKEEIIEALEMVFRRRVGNDPLNRLTIEAGLNWRDVNLLRAYLHYHHQLGLPSTTVFVANTFRQHPHITRLFIDYYRARFDPTLLLAHEERVGRASALAAEIEVALHEVPSTAQDHFLRLLLNLFRATLRTSRYRERDLDDYTIAFKVDSTALAGGSDPRPWREIYVHHFEMEGIHLRGGKLARGGIRWSDRVSDFREEILGLMRTQMVKNVLIVPVGAKGGFVVRRPAHEPTDRREQADRLYRTFIHALLDLTDNVAGGRVTHPEGVICDDEDDPYLVVAADKGTAHLSDAANEISVARGFWLKDAFASGGSQGFDHKALGITARGAWEGVRRHFREMGHDPDRQAFSAVGIGDMSGDVFGNGMLCSPRMRLLAAFNHMHIFIDPDPDPEVSFGERRRLFELPGSSWRDYSPEALSTGGGVHDRQAKLVRLSPEACRLLGLRGREHPPVEVIRRILTLPVDLLWNGGVGTYIKSSQEDNRDVGDITNEAVRVDASQMKAKVIAEGGNLGVTQRGRVDLALRGARINTDFIDNSGGVDCSDHEVNLKILLAMEMQEGRLTATERDSLLRASADDVCAAVLANNSSQGLMLSLDEARSRQDLFSFERVIKTLEDRGILVRDRDCLPNLEALAGRQAHGAGMTRPELAVLSAFCKMEVYRRLLAQPDDAIPGLGDTLSSYFPPEVVSRFGDDLHRHLLGREISLIVMTNLVIDHAGASFFFEMERETGSTVADIARAYLLADEFFQAWGTKEKILELERRVPAKDLYRAIIVIEETARRSMAWLLAAPGGGRFEQVAARREAYAEILLEYEEGMARSLPSGEQRRLQRRVDGWYRAGFAVGLPERLARFPHLTAGLRIADICQETGAAVEEVTRLYFQLGETSSILPLVRKCDDKVFTGRWETLAMRVIRNTLLDSLWAFVSRLAGEHGAGSAPGWARSALERLQARTSFREMRLDLKKLAAEEITIASLQVMSTRLARLGRG
ncbi:MAG: NAD-glutamate dehydrogenase domain-containing protein, partial [Planctomycetota bacterium]